MIPPVSAELLSREELLGERPYSKQATLILPTPKDFELVVVQFLPNTIWRNSRRRVMQTHFDDFTSLVTILIPFLEPGETRPFELIWLYSAQGQVIGKSRNVEEAIKLHQEWVQKNLDAGKVETLLS